jgi:MYXO-CTERM domain-containing protein
MRTLGTMLLAALVVAGIGHGTRAAPVLGSHVSESVFAAALGSPAGWSYLGEGSPTLVFTRPGAGELELRESSYSSSFGFVGLAPGYDHRTVIFGPGAAAGATAVIEPGFAPFLFFFQTVGAGNDTNTRVTDGVGWGPGADQAGIDIFYNPARETYAFFYDDAGGGSGWRGDDNDYNDLVVTYRPAGTVVSEPAAAAILLAAVAGLVLLRRRRASLP